jgi:hypothetical protein
LAAGAAGNQCNFFFEAIHDALTSRVAPIGVLAARLASSIQTVVKSNGSTNSLKSALRAWWWTDKQPFMPA